jgi:hypothetical protein
VTAKLALGLVLALASTAALNWGYLAQHGVAASLPRLELRRPLRSLRLLFANLRWLAGFLAGIGGWMLYVAALALAPLSLVQAVSAGGIGLLALLAARTTGTVLSRSERVAVAVAVAGLALLGLSLTGQHGGATHARWLALAIWVVASLAVAALAAGPASRLLAGGAGLGVAAGVLYAAGDVATKAAVAGGRGFVFVPVVLVCHGLAFVALQFGFQRGGALATAGVATLLTNALPIAAGLTLYAEALPAGTAGVLRSVAFAAVVAAAATLMRGDRVEARADPAPSTRPPAPLAIREEAA